MEVYKILDELESEIEESARIPLTNKVVIQDEILYKYIDKLRATLPEDIRQAQWIRKDRQRIIEEAENEAKKMIDEAKNKIQEMADETEIYKIAEKNSKELIEKAKVQAQEIKEGAFKYADEVMADLELKLGNYLNVIKEGRKQIKQSSKK